MTEPQIYADLVQEARARPLAAAVILGSGMSSVSERCRAVCRIAFTDVPELPATSVAGHNGCLTLGDWAGRRVLLCEGRLHFYEGHSWDDVTRLVHIAYCLGAPVALLTNAAGGIGDAQEPGSLMAIRDHIEWTWPYCWRRRGPGGLGGPRPSPYAPRLLQLLQQAAHEQEIELHTGTYAAVTGPCYETPAEIRALKAWGADAVGMSTAREVQAACDLKIESAAVSCITNRAAGLNAAPINHEEVLLMAHAQSECLAMLVERFLQLLI